MKKPNVLLYMCLLSLLLVSLVLKFFFALVCDVVVLVVWSIAHLTCWYFFLAGFA